MTLYEIKEKRWQLINLPDIPEDALWDTLESLDGDFDSKADDIACVIKDLRGDREKIKAEIDNLQSREKALTRRIDWLTRYIYDNMRDMNRLKIQTPRNILSIRKNPPKVDQSDPKWREKFIDWAQKNKRDDLLYFYDPDPDIKAIKNALLDGEDLPATLVQNERIDIK